MTREIWLRQLKKPFSVIGMVLETAMTKLYKNNKTLTVSNSTKEDLVDLGFKEEEFAISLVSKKLIEQFNNLFDVDAKSSVLEYFSDPGITLGAKNKQPRQASGLPLMKMYR